LIPIFSDVELFLGEMFREDTNIYNASLELTVTTLKAVDRTVAFYTSNERKEPLSGLLLWPKSST
jgi:hypothetical protein